MYVCMYVCMYVIVCVYVCYYAMPTCILSVSVCLSVCLGPGGWNDADLLMTGGPGCENDTNPLAHCPGMTDLEYRTEFTMWCIMGSPLIITTDIRNMTDIMKEVCLCCTVEYLNRGHFGIGHFVLYRAAVFL